MGQPGEDVFEISVGVNLTSAAAFNDGVNNRSAFAGIAIAHEEPVLLAEGRGADGEWVSQKQTKGTKSVIGMGRVGGE